MDLNEFSTLSKDAKIQFSDLRFFGYSKMLTSSDFRSIDTLTLVRTKWSPTLGDSLVNLSVDRLRAWLKTELGIESLDVISE